MHPLRDGAFLSRQFLLLIETPPTFGRSLRCFHILHRNFLLFLFPSSFAACGHHLSPRIVCSLSNVSDSSMSHSSISLISSNTYLVLFLLVHSHSILLCEFYYLLLCHKRICASTSSSSRPLVYLFFLAGPGRLREIAVSAFSRSPLGRANTFSFLSLRSIPRISLNVLPIPPCFLALLIAFPLFISLCGGECTR